MTTWFDPFVTTMLNAGTVSASIQFPPSGGYKIEIKNVGNKLAHVAFGDAGIVATLADYPVIPSETAHLCCDILIGGWKSYPIRFYPRGFIFAPGKYW